ncbi:MAG: InlB B-repeat-containing protein [Sedimentibacter sp.]
MKRFISLLLVLTIFVNTIMSGVTASALTTPDSMESGYTDMVTSDYWSYEALTTAIDSGLIQGKSNKINPYDEMTRGEMMTIILRALGIDFTSQEDLTSYLGDISAFTDVKSSDWFYNQMAIAYRLRLIEGISDAKMSPKGIVTREQAFTVISRLMTLNSTSVDTTVLNEFTDVGDISSWAKSSVAAMVTADYVSGYNGYLNPGDAITRQEFAQLMYTLFKDNYISSQAAADALTGQYLAGNLIVSADNITIANLSVYGDVIIGDGVGNGSVTLDQVKITGKLIIRGGGENTIHLKNTTADTIMVNKLSDGGLRIYGEDGTEVSYVEILDGKDTIIVECNVKNLVISDDDIDVTINETVQNLSISGNNVRVSGTGNINAVTLEEDAVKVTLELKNTKVTNKTGGDVTVIGKYGKSTVVKSAASITANKTNSNSSSTSSTEYTLAFHSNGGADIESQVIKEGTALSGLPVPKKDNAIFIGWFTDNESLENSVAKDTLASSDMDLYAKYIESTQQSELNLQTTASVVDVATNYELTILSTNSSMTADEVKAGITVTALTEEEEDDNEAVFEGITVIKAGENFTLKAIDGYTLGASYSMELMDEALNFQNENTSVRTYNISIEMPDPVLKLKLSSNVKFLPVDEINAITQNGEAVDTIFAPLYSLDEDTTSDSFYGTFNYVGSQSFFIGDQVAIYEGTIPEDRIAGLDYSEEQISYITISSINGSSISYSNTDSSEVIFMPDVLPVNALDDRDGDTNNSSITIATSKMTYTGSDFEAMGLTASTTIDTGDFIAFYTGDTPQSATALIYAEITSVTSNKDFYVIQYDAVSEAYVLTSMDMASSSDVNYDQLASNMDFEETEEEIQRQIEDSGFAEGASEFLIQLSQANEETRKQVSEQLGIQNFMIFEMPLSTSGDSSAPKVKVNTKITKNLNHYSGDGLRCEITVTSEVELNDDMTLVVSGTFVEEFKVKLNINSKTIWKKKWIIPYIYDYQVNANLDVYSYTYLGLKMNLTTADSEGLSEEFNIMDSIEELKDMTSSTDANDEVQMFYDLYKDLLSEEHGYFELFNVNISKVTGSVDPFHIIAYGLSVDFVVSLDANMALGTEFSYEKATRYSYSLKIKDKSTTSSQTSLVNEQYSFQVYAMGELGLRAGIQVTVEVGLLDIRLASIGTAAQVGAYWKIYGFVYYKLEHTDKVTKTESGGACYMEIGTYLTIKFITQVANGKIAYNKILYSKEWPLWSAGGQYYTYDFGYELTDKNDDINIKGTERTYTLPSSVFQMAQMDFKTGDVAKKTVSSQNYTYTIKDDPNNAFSVSKAGVVTVSPPTGSDIANATLEVVWSAAPLSFTSVPISRTYSLTWDNLASSYNIRFNSNGGSNISSIRGAYKSSITLPKPVRDGYVFEGWYTDNGTFSKAFTQKTMPASNYELYAKWSAGTAVVTIRHYQKDLNSNDYTLVGTTNSINITGSTVKPEVENYSGFISPVAQTATVAGDSSTIVSYYYNRDSYNLTFVPDNGSVSSSNSLTYGTEIVVPSFVKTGYTFIGWNTNPVTTMPAQNLSYTAQWSLNNYSINYDLVGGSVGVSNPTAYTIVGEDITLVNPTKANYIFDGWTGTGIVSKKDSVTIPSGSTGNRYYTATWKPSTDTDYSVYHYREDLTGEYTILDVELLKGTTESNTEALAKAYIGYTPDSFSQEVIEADESTTVLINYPRNSYIVTFDANGGTGGTTNSIKYGYDIIEPSVTRAGYAFTGWDADVLSIMGTEDLTYTAQWTKTSASTANVTILHYQQNANRDEYTLVDTKNSIETTDSNVTPEVENYPGFISPETQTVTVAEDDSAIVSYYYLRQSYTLTFVTDNGSSNIVSFIAFGTEIVEPILVKSGYTFASWDDDVVQFMPAENLTYTALWELSSDISYTVNHYKEDLDGDFTIFEVESLKGTTGSNTEAIAKSYIGFTPESFDQELIEADGLTTVAINYSRNSYTVTFDANGGVGGTTNSIKYEAEIIEPSVSRTGYEFIGWDDDVLSIMGTENLTYTALWELSSDIDYTVNHYKEDLDGDFTIFEVESLKGTTGSNTEAIAKSYIGFTPESFDQELIEADGLTTVAINYSRNSYTVTFDANGGVGGTTNSIKYEAEIIEPSVSRTGYEFNGWDDDVLSIMGTENLTYIAQWETVSAGSGNIGIFDAKYSAEYQMFDFITYSSTINGNAYDSSWGTGGDSSGHQFSDLMLTDRYITISKTDDTSYPIAIYIYESDGTPVASVSEDLNSNLYSNSLISSQSNETIAYLDEDVTILTEGLLAVGEITNLWDEGFMFNSANGFGYFISGKNAYSSTGTISLNNEISSPEMAELEAISDYEEGPLLAD